MVLRLLDDGRVLYGGTPPRFMKLTESGRDVARSLFRGADQPDGQAPLPGRSALHSRLVTAGMVPPARPVSGRSLPSFGMVIPHFNNPAGAVATAACLLTAVSCIAEASESPGMDPSIVVVDDGSDGPARHELRRRLGVLDPRVTVLDLAQNQGPGAARNLGAASIDAEVIVFADCDVSISQHTLEELLSWLTDDSIAACAPRIRPTEESGVIARYEKRCSALDVAPNDSLQPTLVGPGRQVVYVPSTVLVARSEVFRSLGGFDAGLRFGEDVDLIWRLASSSNHVLLDPSVSARHPARSSLADLAEQRYRYGTSAASLATRHRDVVAPAAVSPAMALAAAAGLVLPRLAAGPSFVMAAAWDARLRARSFAEATSGLPGSAALGATESLRSNLASARSVVRALNRTWWPITMALVAQPWS
ncbi:MAG: glycosyltransferase, partial [Acidimicrobiia bacterium]